MLSKYRVFALAALAIVALFAVAISACGDDDDADAAAETTAAQKAQVLAIAAALRGEGLHDFDEEINAASEIDAGWAGKATRLRQMFKSVDWPAELADHAAAVQQAFDDLDAALQAEELADAKTAVTASHEAWHEAEHAVYPWLAGEEPPAEEDHGGSDESATPEAS